jgi:hypothetical protein
MDCHESSITVRAAWIWWAAWSMVAFAAMGSLGAWSLGFVCVLTGWKPGLPGVLCVWGVLVATFMACVIHMARQMTWTLTATDLRQGKRRPVVVFRFDEIESMVIGVPMRPPRFPRGEKILPVLQSIRELHRTSVLVRLQGGRRILLNLLSAQFRNGPLLTRQFLQLNEAKVVGADTYTERELSKMQRAVLNQVFRYDDTGRE